MEFVFFYKKINFKYKFIMKYVVDAFHNRPLVFVKDRNYIVTPLTDHEPGTPFELLEDTVKELSKLSNFSLADKILGEEDRGGFLAALMAYEHKKPLGMVKWNPNGLEGQQAVQFRNAYTEGTMYINGIQPGDKVILVEDMVDSGGTIIGMIELLGKIKVELLDVVVIAEKEEFEGIKRIKDETGFDVKALLKFNSSMGNKAKVTEILVPTSEIFELD
jgi:adenine/guanine phosphoribosyltransferase-like PRPP-binding protein